MNGWDQRPKEVEAGSVEIARVILGYHELLPMRNG